MAKKIRTPLVMADGAEVRELSELREHFDLEKVIEYYKSGKLVSWLRIRYIDGEADAIEALDENAPTFQQQLCEILGVEFTGKAVDLEDVARRQERLAKLREFTDEKELIDHIDQIAFNQEDLADLLDEGSETIYLCGKYFIIPARCDHVTYIGVNQPTVHITGLEKGKPLSTGIHFQQVNVDNLPRTGGNYEALDADWVECYILNTGDELPEGVKETDSVEAWLKRCYKELGLDETEEIDIVVSPKLDGVALRCEIDSENCMNTPLMRRDGKDSILVKGMDGIVTFDVPSISKTPFGCQFEVFVAYEDVEKASKYLKLDKPYVSPRHAASGIVNRLCTNPDNKLIKYLSFYPINAVDLEGSYIDRLEKIRAYGNLDVSAPKVLSGDLKRLLEKIGRRFRKFNNKRSSLSYAIDGMVLSLAKDEYQDELGRSGRSNKWQIALKFDPASAVGEVKGIELSSGKKGFRTIQIVLKEPVVIEGVKYDHIPALSADIFEKFDLCEGDIVRVRRVGDVIPSISIEKRKGGKKIELPEDCPTCEMPMIWESKKLKCTNPSCPDNKAGRILTFLSYAGIKGIGEAEARSWVDAGLDICDIVRYPIGATHDIDEHDMDEDDDDYCDYDEDFCLDQWKAAGYSRDQAIEIQNQIIHAVKNMFDYEFVGNYGIMGVGPATTKKIYKANIRPGYEDEADNGEKIVYDNYTDTDQISKELEEYSDNVRYENSPRKGLLSGICYLGWPGLRLDISDIVEFADRFCKKSTPEHFANLKSVGHTGGNPSKETQKLIRDLGWELVDGKKFDYLIVPGYDHESTKTKYAKDKGKEIFTEEDFVEEFSEEI